MRSWKYFALSLLQKCLLAPVSCIHLYDNWKSLGAQTTNIKHQGETKQDEQNTGRTKKQGGETKGGQKNKAGKPRANKNRAKTARAKQPLAMVCFALGLFALLFVRTGCWLVPLPLSPRADHPSALGSFAPRETANLNQKAPVLLRLPPGAQNCSRIPKTAKG